MPQRLIECIPNFSEGQDETIIEAIKKSIEDVPGVHLLDQHSDADHNRTVFTFAGPPEAVAKAAFYSIAQAAEHIDMDQHTGEHPRLGATDVVPFVPLSGVTMDECVELAHELGRKVGRDLEIPVYFYESAATRPDRANLEDVRRGEYEALKEEISSNPDREPDAGPRKLGKAGACVIGARQPLIAFNVYLATDEVSVAKKIARAVRHSSGGLRYVKALGLEVEGLAQVSMNLTHYEKTPLARVVELIRSEAQRHGTAILYSELVGLIPQNALVDAAQWYLQLDSFEPDQILESRLYAALSEEGGSASTFLQELSQGTATPGGGSAAAYSGAMAAALVGMVARLSTGRERYAAVEERMHAIAEEADHLRQVLERAVERDSAAFDAVMKAYKLPKGAPEERSRRKDAIRQATQGATEVPLDVAANALRVIELANEVAEFGNVNAVTDAGSAGVMAYAAIQAAAMNVRVNADSLEDEEASEGWRDKILALEKQATDLKARIGAMVAQRAGIEMVSA
jgi:glutamate formiminotransferase/formiminotetrahydrofolate cyclodeaminase